MLTKERKNELVKKFAASATDRGSTSVQVALLTERISSLTKHLKSHKKDYSTQLGLLKLVGQRRRLLSYLKRRDFNAYGQLLKQLELRK